MTACVEGTFVNIYSQTNVHDRRHMTQRRQVVGKRRRKVGIDVLPCWAYAAPLSALSTKSGKRSITIR